MGRSTKRSKRSGKQPGSDYAVGYKRPPIATRFRAGGVGNPRGRPKKQKTVNQIIEEGLTTRMRIEKNGRSETKMAMEHIIANLIEAAARGEMRAINTLFALQHRYKDSPETMLNPAELDREDREILEEYLATVSKNGTDLASSSSQSEGNNGDESESPSSEPSSNSNHSGDET
jgi:hypothetical protein